MKEELEGLYGKLDPLYLDPGFRVTDVSIWKEPKRRWSRPSGNGRKAGRRWKRSRA